jgi:hypothetical protein
MADPVEQEREKFEAWAKLFNYWLKRHLYGEGEYLSPETNAAWEGWKGKAGLS